MPKPSRLRTLGISFAFLLTGTVWRCQAAVVPAASQRERLQTQIDRQYDDLAELYTHLHTHPELSSNEVQTGARIGQELEKAGFVVTTKVGGNGVVGVLTNGAGPTVLLRTDLDGLPVKEDTGATYASKAQGTDPKGKQVPVMHACGHDIHMTCLVGAARLLAATKAQWKGTVVLIGQPAEETGRGARRMLADGLFTRFPKPDYVLALHVSAKLPAGTVGYVEGYAMANVDTLSITIRGVGGHGAWPHSTKDPIVLAAETVVALQTIVSRETPPGEAAVVTVGSIHGGTKHNIIPDQVDLQLTLRSFTDEVRQHTLQAVNRIVRGLAQAAGMPEDRMPIVQPEDEFTPALFNDPKLSQRVAQALKPWLGESKVVPEKPVMGGEDFSEYGRTADKIPVSLFWLGAVSPERIAGHRDDLPSLHSSRFLPVPEPTIKTGVMSLLAAVYELAPAE